MGEKEKNFKIILEVLFDLLINWNAPRRDGI